MLWLQCQKYEKLKCLYFLLNVDIRYYGNFNCRKIESKMPFPEGQKGQPNDLLWPPVSPKP